MANNLLQGFVAEAVSSVFGRPSHKHKRSFFTKIAGASARLLRRLVLLLMLSMPSVMLWADTDTVSGTDFWGGLGKSVWGSTEGWAQDKLGEGRGAARLVATAGELFSVNAEGSDWREELDGRLENARLDLMRRGVRSGFDSVFGFVTNRLDEDRFRLKSDYRLGLAEGERGWWHTDAMGLLSGFGGSSVGEGLYWQMGARNGGGYGTGEADDDQRTLLNAGLGMRRLVWDGDWLLMGHMFYDRERAVGHSRAGLGVEAKGRHLDVYGNVYHALSDRVRVGNRWEQVRGGWEVALSGRLPRVDWLELSVSHSEWDEVLGVAGESETDYGVKMQVTPLVRFEGSYEDASDADSSWSGELVFEYKFGEGISGQPSARMLKLISPEERMWEFARRDYSMKKGDVELKVATPEDDQLRGQSSPASSSPAPSDAFPFGMTYRDDGYYSPTYLSQNQILVVHTDKLPGSPGDPLTLTMDFDDAVPSGESLSVTIVGTSDVGYRIVGARVFAAGSTPRVMIERKGYPEDFSDDTFTFVEDYFLIRYSLIDKGGTSRHAKYFHARLIFLPSQRTVTIKEDVDPPITGRSHYHRRYQKNNVDFLRFNSGFPLSGPDKGRVQLKGLENNYIGISLAHVPDYESPKDADRDNMYTLHMSRSGWWVNYPSAPPSSPIQTIFVEVEDVMNVGDFPDLRFELQENSETVFVAGKPRGAGQYEYTLKKSKADDPDDNGYFELMTNTDSGEAQLKFKVAPDYEKPRGVALTDPTEENLAAANIYTVRVSGKFGNFESDTGTVLVTVTNADEDEEVVYSGFLGDGGVFVEDSFQDVSLNVYGGTPGRRVSVTVGSAFDTLALPGGGTVTSFMAADYSASAPFVLTLRYSGKLLAADTDKVGFTLWHDDGDGNINGVGIVKTPLVNIRNDISLNKTVVENQDLVLAVSDYETEVGAKPDRTKALRGADRELFVLDEEGNLRFRKAPDFESESHGPLYTVWVRGEQMDSRESDGAVVTVEVLNEEEDNPFFTRRTSHHSLALLAGVKNSPLWVYIGGGTPNREMTLTLEEGSDWSIHRRNSDGYVRQISRYQYQYRISGETEIAFINSSLLPPGETFIKVGYDDGDGNVGMYTVTATAYAVPLGHADLTATENELTLSDFPGIHYRASHAVRLNSRLSDSNYSPDNAYFAFERRGDEQHLVFREGDGGRSGKWPDADEVSDADGDGVYTVSFGYWPNSNSLVHRGFHATSDSDKFTYTAHVSVDSDPLEGVKFLSSLEHEVEDGKMDTGYRLKASSGLGRSLSYRIESGGDGDDFELGGGDSSKLHFKSDPGYDGETLLNNVRTLTVVASDDDPGTVKNEVTATLTVTVLPVVVFIEDAQTLSARENTLSVGDVPRPASGAVNLSLRGADAGLFDLDGARLSFKPGEGDASGKWPDADDHGDADGDGVYELQVHQSLGSLWRAKYDLEVTVAEDVREDLGRRTHGEVTVEEGTTDTGVRLGKGRDGLSRKLSYSVRGSKLAGSLFEVRNGNELHFREAAEFGEERRGLSNIYIVLVDTEDDDPGTVKNRGYDEVTVSVLARFASESLSGTAEENELSVTVGGFLGLNPHVTVSLGGGADAEQFELSGRALSFKAGTGEAQGKWPDADETGDADGDGKYTVELVQNTRFLMSTSTVTVGVSADAREALSFSSGTSVVTESDAVDTGYRALAVSGLDDRQVGDYDVVSGGDGSLFDIADDVLSFRAAQPWVSGGSNRYTVTLKATDDDPGDVKNEAFVTVTVEVGEPLVSGTVSGTAKENGLSVTVADLSGLSSSVKLSIVGGADMAHFELSGSELRFVTMPDCDGTNCGDEQSPPPAGSDGKYTVEIEQVDGARSSTATVTVGVDADDVEDSLAFSPTSLSVTAREGDVGAFHKSAAAGGAPGRKLSYSLPGDVSGLFELVKVGEGKRELSFSGADGAPHNEDGVNEYTVTIRAEDDDPGDVKNVAEQTVTVSVEAVPGPTAVAFAPGEELRRDEGENVADIVLPAGEGGLGELRYVLGMSEGDAHLFKRKGSDSSGVTVGVSSLDYESASVHTLTLTVLDRRDRESVGKYVLDVDDVKEEVPVIFVDGEILEIDEEDTGYVVLTSRASGGVGGGFDYNLATPTKKNDNWLFALGPPGEGVSLRFVDKPDYENPAGVQKDNSDVSRRNDYLVDMEARDSDGNIGVAHVTVRVRDVEGRRLKFEGGATVTIKHADNAWPALLHQAIVTNAVDGEVVTYELVSSAVSGRFKVNKESGNVKFSGAPLEYDSEGGNVYTVTVKATTPRGGGVTVTGFQTLELTALEASTVSVSLEFKGGASVTAEDVMVSASGAAPTGSLHRSYVPGVKGVVYSLEDGKDGGGLFKVNSRSGNIKFEDGVILEADGPTTTTSYKVTVKAKLGATMTSQTVTILINGGTARLPS